jgi:hypothetical protein
MQEQFNMNVQLNKTLPVLCESCGNPTFKEVMFIRKVSKFISGTPQDGMIPIPTFACDSCGNINEEFKPKINDQE